MANINRIFTISGWRAQMVEHLRPALSFDASSMEDYQSWKRGFEKEFLKLLGLLPEPVTLESEVIESVVFPTYIREKIVFNSERFMSVPAWVCSPRETAASGRHPAVICCHGHGNGKDALVGILGNNKSGVDYQKRLAIKLAENGFVAIAPDWRCFGERRDPPEILSLQTDMCDRVHIAVESFGYHLLSLNIWDGMKTIDYLESRKDVDPTRIGCVGCSFGGTMSMFLSAADSRISAACVSGYLMATGDSPISSLCGSQTLPGLLTWGDRAEVAGLICPRPLLVQIGEYDSTFPARHALSEFRRLSRIYQAADAEFKLGLDLFEGCHEVSTTPIIEWFNRWLIKL